MEVLKTGRGREEGHVWTEELNTGRRRKWTLWVSFGSAAEEKGRSGAPRQERQERQLGKFRS